MATGKLVKILLHTKVTRYLEWKSIDASYVYKKEKVFKVPATGTEAISSSLLGLFEKRRFRNFLMYLADYDKDKPASHKGYDLRTIFEGSTDSRSGLRQESCRGEPLLVLLPPSRRLPGTKDAHERATPVRG